MKMKDKNFICCENDKTDWNPDDFPIPEWAIKKSNGAYLEVGAQLATRDGRRLGNAFVKNIDVDDIFGVVVVVVTDIGNELILTEPELQELFFPPSYVMDVTEALVRRGAQ